MMGRISSPEVLLVAWAVGATLVRAREVSKQRRADSRPCRSAFLTPPDRTPDIEVRYQLALSQQVS
jgi:hypothetical protein